MRSDCSTNNGPDFLIIGLQKSGSTWVSGLLNAHPEINCYPIMLGEAKIGGVGEGHIFDYLSSIEEDGGEQFKEKFKKKHDGFFADLVEFLDKVNKYELYDMFRERNNEWWELHRKKRLVGEKTTEYVFCLDIIDYFYPNINKVCILRDPKDRIVSFNFHQIRHGRKQETAISDEFITEYMKRVQREYMCLLNYHGQIHCLTYEALLEKPVETIRKILEYLNVEHKTATIQKMIESASFEKMSSIDGYNRQLTEAIKKVIQIDFILFKSRIIRKIIHRLLYALMRFNNNLFYNNQNLKTFRRKIGTEDQNSFYRKGVSGDWANHLTKEQAYLIDRNIKDIECKVIKTRLSV